MTRLPLDITLGDPGYGNRYALNMAKYLRYAEVRGFLGRSRQPTADERDTNRLAYLVGCPNWHTGATMYFRSALPVECPHVQKLNIYGCPNSPTLCDEPVLGIASVWVNVPPDPSSGLGSCRLQQAFALELAHTAVLSAAERFSFDVAPFLAAKKQVEENDYALRYQIGKTRKSPNRKFAASVWCHFDTQYRSELLVTSSDGSLRCRYQFATGDERSIGQLRWHGNEQVHVPLAALPGDAYWACSLDETFSFRFPKSEGGSAHHLYQHATMLLDGPWVMPDSQRGMQLLESAANAGYKHAIRRLQHMKQNHAVNPSGGSGES
ncbi:hypothetical protein EC9_51430 [Rosistilla ulvae]|uniref:Uncharacterized protein n=1 Tax=Rosistilla ulvae TaxID=1930277 RepID=A0A517M7T2_9BACT|nr:hypothetical protein [Rosistilla ulvae]QDS90925.1 hypothetical protein EC9_51430 [Rosistilla ulvae]